MRHSLRLQEQAGKAVPAGRLLVLRPALLPRAGWPSLRQPPTTFITARSYHSSIPCLKSKGKSKAPAAAPVEWETLIGLEIHAQLKSSVKLFSSTRTAKDAPPNTAVSAFDASFPGTLPALSKEPLALAVRLATALECDVQTRSSFDRKHYFYRDLPAGYQITQQYAPLAKSGRIRLSPLDEGVEREVDVGIQRVQLEQDTGKSYPQPSSETLVDLNRAGTALVEIVSDPDMRTPLEAVAFVKKLRSVLRKVDAGDGNMEEGSLRCDVNVNVRSLLDSSVRSSRVEVKNLNSLKSMSGAIAFEAARHVELLKRGETVEQETRGYEPPAGRGSGSTYRLRSKEDAPDYRFMPDPNLRPLILHPDDIAAIRASLPELPDVTRARLIEQYGLSKRDANVLLGVGEDEPAGQWTPAVEYFERVAAGRNPKTAINWILHELLGQLASREIPWSQNPVTAERLGEFLDVVDAGEVIGASAKTLLTHLITSPTTPIPSVLDAHDLRPLPSSALEPLCAQALEALPEEAEKARSGHPKVLQRIIGEVMKRAGGRADGKTIGLVLRKMLGLGDEGKMA